MVLGQNHSRNFPFNQRNIQQAFTIFSLVSCFVCITGKTLEFSVQRLDQWNGFLKSKDVKCLRAQDVSTKSLSYWIKVLVMEKYAYPVLCCCPKLVSRSSEDGKILISSSYAVLFQFSYTFINEISCVRKQMNRKMQNKKISSNHATLFQINFVSPTKKSEVQNLLTLKKWTLIVSEKAKPFHCDCEISKTLYPPFPGTF